MSFRNKSTYAASVNNSSAKASRPSSYVTLVSNTSEKKKQSPPPPPPPVSTNSNSSNDHILNKREGQANESRYSNRVGDVVSSSAIARGDVSKLLLNIKLLKESLRGAAMMGEAHFDRELESVVSSEPNTQSHDEGIIAESVWLVKRAISELHVVYNRRKNNNNVGGGSNSVSAEFSLAGQLTEARALILQEKEERLRTEKKIQALEAMWQSEKLKLQEHSQESLSQAVAMARKEGALGAERLAERLKRSEEAYHQLEHKLREAESRNTHTAQPLPIESNNSNPNSNSNKDRKTMSLEKQVATFRRKESELTSQNINLEAKVDRLSKELKATRPAPNSRGKMAELTTKVDELDRMLNDAHTQLKESREMQHELSSEVASLSVARAERDDIIMSLEQTVQHHESMCHELKQEVQELQVALNQSNKDTDKLASDKEKLENQLKILKSQCEQQIENISKSAKNEMQRAIYDVEVTMNEKVEMLESEKSVLSDELSELHRQAEHELRAKDQERQRLAEEYEEAIRRIEDENMSQLNKARSHCEVLTAEKLSWQEDKDLMSARIAELTASLKESQNARLELQVRVHESSVECDKFRKELLLMQEELNREEEARNIACKEVMELRDQIAVLRQLESQIQSLLQGKKVDNESLRKAQHQIARLSNFDAEMKVKDEKISMLSKECSELKMTIKECKEVRDGDQAAGAVKQLEADSSQMMLAEERAASAAAALSSVRAAASAQKTSLEKKILSLEEELKSGERREAELNRQLSTARKNLTRRSSRSDSALQMTPPRTPPPCSLANSSGLADTSQINGSEDSWAADAQKSGKSYIEERRKAKVENNMSNAVTSNTTRTPTKRINTDLQESSLSLSQSSVKRSPGHHEQDVSTITHPQSTDDSEGTVNPLVGSQSSSDETLSMEELKKVLEQQQKQIERLEQNQNQNQNQNQTETDQNVASELNEEQVSASSKPNQSPTTPQAVTVSRRASKTPETPVYLHPSYMNEGGHINSEQRTGETSSTNQDTSSPSIKPLTHSTHITNACASIWSGIGLYCVKKKCTIQQVWTVEFDRARTSRNTASQFSSGIGRCGFRVSASESLIAFREMHDEGRKKKAEEEANLIKSDKSLPYGLSRSNHGSGVMLEGTIGTDDFVDAAGRWLSMCLSESELSSLGLGQLGVDSGGKVDILDDLNEECTFSPKLYKSTSFRSRPSFKTTTRSSSDQTHSSSSNVTISSGTVTRKKAPTRAPSPHSQSSRNHNLSSQGSNSARGTVGSSMKGQHRSSMSGNSSNKNSFDLSEALDNIIGQEKLKEQLLAFEKGIELQARRKELGIDCDGAWPPHMMFCGNPGTGKTTIARLVGLVLKKLGVLKKGHLVEVQRSDLVAGAIGQTALKTRDKINEARGGVLFVDEAYTLAPLGSAETKDFGREAINEIMSVMNDGDPVVIFAGYKKEMETFVQANAGLFRRIDVRYDFEDYSTLELALILRREVTTAGFRLHTDVTDEVVARLLETHTEEALRNAMGGGLSRQLFRKARGKLDAELSLDATPEAMCTLSEDNLTSALAEISPFPDTSSKSI